ncbi:MAG: response regulator [Bacteroidales bacterium]|nr:response regulator [Bacteroidales bacterium]
MNQLRIMDVHQELIKFRQEEKRLRKKEVFNKKVTYPEQTNRDGKIYSMTPDSDHQGTKGQEENASESQRENKNDRPRRILIVEDDRVSILYIKELISMMDTPGLNIQVKHVFTGERALDHIREEHCDMVLMDLKLPGIDGLETTREIKRIKPFLPVIAQTAFALSGDEQKALEAGCDDYISKPISEKDLTDIIKRFLAPS